EQHLTLAAAAARTRTQRPGKHLAVHASELVVKPDFQILRRYRRPLLLRLEHTHRPTLEDYVHRATRLGSSRSLNLRIGISAVSRHHQATSPGRLTAPSHSADSPMTPSSRLWRPQGDDRSLATLSWMAGASAEEEINEPTGKFLRRRGDILRL